MKRRWSYVAGLFLLMLGIFTGCEGLPELLDIPDQGVVREEDAEGNSSGREGTSEEDASKEDASKEDGSDKEDNANEKGSTEEESDAALEVPAVTVQEDGEYASKEEVAAYLHEYGHLPDNFITKKDAQALGWVSSEGNLHEVAPGKSIGGDYFGNYEEILPKQSGRKYYECDIDTDGSYRGAKRIVYSSDGLIYYTEDHYTTFELLYTKDGPVEE